jgi:hypothetical protein
MELNMAWLLLPLVWLGQIAPGAAGFNPAARTACGYLCQPAYSLDEELRGPAHSYFPQAGDIFLATDQSFWMRAGHWLAGGKGVHHSGLLFMRSDGRPALIEAGPFNKVQVEILDPSEHMHHHAQSGDRVWIRQRSVPLTPEQSASLTAFAEAQEGKPFACVRLVAQITPFRTRGSLRTAYLGGPHGERDCYFCSELVLESCVAAGLLDPATTRPSATYPRDLFFGHSSNPYLDKHLPLERWWLPPARWQEWGSSTVDPRSSNFDLRNTGPRLTHVSN